MGPKLGPHCKKMNFLFFTYSVICHVLPYRLIEHWHNLVTLYVITYGVSHNIKKVISVRGVFVMPNNPQKIRKNVSELKNEGSGKMMGN